MGRTTLAITRPTTAALSSSVRWQGKYDLAVPLLREVLDAQERKLGPTHPLVLANKSNLAGLYLELGDNQRALALWDGAFDAFAKLEANHPTLLQLKSNSAVMMIAAGKYRQAELSLLDLVPMAEERLGDDHPLTLTIKNNLAHALHMQGNSRR